MPQQNSDPNRTERAASIRADQARKERNKRVAMTAGIIAVLAVVVAAGVWYSSGGSDPAAGASKTPRVTVGNSSLIVGNNPNAKVKLVVYEDFLCPFCKQFETQTRDFLHADAAQGKVLIEYRPFQLLADGYSRRALDAWSAVLKNGTPAQALRFHDVLYDNQPYESAANKPDIPKLQALAKKAGVKQSVLDAFATEDTSFYAAVEKAAQDAKIQGTPTILLNGKELSGNSIDDMVNSLEKQIAGS
ncbi:MAG: thioredoxin domain-containing protein [Marmoricola sp.]